MGSMAAHIRCKFFDAFKDGLAQGRKNFFFAGAQEGAKRIDMKYSKIKLEIIPSINSPSYALIIFTNYKRHHWADGYQHVYRDSVCTKNLGRTKYRGSSRIQLLFQRCYFHLQRCIFLNFNL